MFTFSEASFLPRFSAAEPLPYSGETPPEPPAPGRKNGVVCPPADDPQPKETPPRGAEDTCASIQEDLPWIPTLPPARKRPPVVRQRRRQRHQWRIKKVPGRPRLAKSAVRLLTYLEPMVEASGGAWLDLDTQEELAEKMSKGEDVQPISARSIDRGFAALEGWADCPLVFSSGNLDSGRGRVKRVATRAWIEALPKHDQLPLHFRSDGRARGTRRSFRKELTITSPDSGSEKSPSHSIENSERPTDNSAPRTPEPAAAVTPATGRETAAAPKNVELARRWREKIQRARILWRRISTRTARPSLDYDRARAGLRRIADDCPEIQHLGGPVLRGKTSAAAIKKHKAKGRPQPGPWPRLIGIGGLAKAHASWRKVHGCEIGERRWLRWCTAAARLAHAAWRDGQACSPAAYAIGTLRRWIRAGEMVMVVPPAATVPRKIVAPAKGRTRAATVVELPAADAPTVAEVQSIFASLRLDFEKEPVKAPAPKVDHDQERATRARWLAALRAASRG